MDLAEWMATRLQILDKQTGALIPYMPHDEQRKLDYALGLQQSAGLPGRLIVLKARRRGVSTWTQGTIFAMCHLAANKQGYCVSHSEESAAYLLEMSHSFDRHLPGGERLPKARSNPTEIIWSPPHSSRFEMHTAGAGRTEGEAKVGRSRRIDYLHVSELAFCEGAASMMRGLVQGVPDAPGTLIVIESTANGAAGEFYDRWQAAIEDKHKRMDPTGYLPVFISWLTAPEYSLVLRAGEDLGTPTERERDLILLGARPEQLNWRRHKIAQDFGGDEDRFCQEYPAEPSEAFVTSGRPAIPASIIRRHDKLSCEPRRCVALDGGKLIGVPMDSPRAWWVWREPVDSHDYIVFGDVMEGSLSDASDPRSQPDFNGGVVLDRRTMEIVASIQTRMDPDLFGEQLMAAGRWYNNAWASPEANASGVAAVLPFVRKNYLHLYQRQRLAESLSAGDDAPLWGWKTTVANRDLMIDSWIALCRPDAGNDWSGKAEVYDRRIVAEEKTFVWRGAKRQHQVGAHDDLLFACFGAGQLHLNCPRQFPLGQKVLQPMSGDRGLYYDLEGDDEPDEDWRTG